MYYMTVGAVMCIAPNLAVGERDNRVTETNSRLAVLRLDPLGVDTEQVSRLESLFRIELERLSGNALPSRADVARARMSRRLRRCDGADKCVAAIGRKLKVDTVVTGNVAGLGESYVINIKAVDTKTSKQIRRIEEPLRGNPDELIEAVRVAAYRLLAPERLKGAIRVLSSVKGATVMLDGKPVGKTPLGGPIGNIALGSHEVRVQAAGFEPVIENVRVRFQKTSGVVIHLVRTTTEAARSVPTQPAIIHKPAQRHWYTSPWMFVGAGVAAAVLGGYIGYRITRDPITRCGEGNMCAGN